MTYLKDKNFDSYYKQPLEFNGYQSNLFYPPSIIPARVAAGTQITAGYIYYVPFIPIITHIFTGIVIANTNTSYEGVTIDVGIYNNASNNLPGTRLLSAPQITVGATAALNISTISQQLTKGTLYWLACRLSSTVVIIYGATTSATYTSSSHSILYNNGLSSLRAVSSAYYSLLDAFGEINTSLPATATPAILGPNYPVIYLRG